MNIFKKYLSKIFIGLLAFSAFLLILIFTNFGQQIITRTIINFTPNLKIEKITGNLFTNLTLDEVNYKNEKIDFNAKQLNIDLKTSCLLQLKICVDKLELNNTNLLITNKSATKNEQTQNNNQTNRLNIPLEIDLQNVKVNQLHLKINEHLINLESFVGNAYLYEDQIQIKNTSVKDLSIVLASTEESPKEEQKFDLKTTLQNALLKQGFSLNIGGNITLTDFNAQTVVLATTNTSIIKIYQLNTTAQLQPTKLIVSTLQMKTNRGLINTKLNLGFNDLMPLDLTLQATNAKILHLAQTDFNATITGNLLDKLDLNLISKKGMITGEFKGSINLHKAPVTFTIDANIQDTNLPIYDLILHNSFLQLDGNLLDFKALGNLNILRNEENLNIELNSQLNWLNKIPQIQFSNTKIQLLENKLNLQGIFSEKLDLNVSLQLNQLQDFAKFYPIKLPNNLQGLIQGDLKLKGDLADPHFDLQTKVKQFTFQNISVNDLNLQISGTAKSHQFALNGETKEAGITIQGTGSFNQKTQIWNSIIKNNKIALEGFNELKNQKEIKISFDLLNNELKIGENCWINSELSLCANKQIEIGKTGNIDLSLNNFNLNALNKILPNDSDFKGYLTSNAVLHWNEKQTKLNLKITGKNLEFLQNTFENKKIKLPISNFNLQSSFDKGELRLQTKANFAQYGDLDIKLETTDLNNKEISGLIKLDKFKLELFNALLSKDEQINGIANANIRFEGQATHPNLFGNLKIDDIQAVIYKMPFDITKGNLKLSFDGNKSNLHGLIYSNENNLQISGTSNFIDENDLQISLKVQSKGFPLDVPSFGKMKISPNVEIKLKDKELSLLGKIDVPSARIVINNLQSGLPSTSNDEFIINNDEFNAVPKASKFMINSNLKLNLGDKVSFQGFGLKTNLIGNLTIKQEQNNLGLFGNIDLKDGEFKSFGQDLLVRKGKINFVGSSTPSLDMEAIRNPISTDNAQITAGIKATGDLRKLNIKVFSDPVLSDEEALSYLLTGSLNSSEQDSRYTNSAITTLLGVGLSQSANVVSKIGELFKLQDINLTIEGLGDNTKVSVANIINSRLRLKYSYGIFNSLSEFVVRYRIFYNFYAQFISGVNNKLELIYRFEFD